MAKNEAAKLVRALSTVDTGILLACVSSVRFCVCVRVACVCVLVDVFGNVCLRVCCVQ